MQTNKYVRKVFAVNAVQVTAENLFEVAEWCGGEVKAAEDGKAYVKVKVHRPLNEKQTRAQVGDWVLESTTGFKVYTERAFANSFDVPEETVNVFDQVEELQVTAEPAQDGIEADRAAQAEKPQPEVTS